MANELRTGYNGSATIYVIIRRLTDNAVWDITNTTWQTWADGSIGDYDLPTASKGGDLYAVDFPTSIVAGTNFRASFYKQAGGSPAITDLQLDVQEGTWTGIATTSAPDSQTITAGDVIDRARLKINDDDPARYRFIDTIMLKWLNDAMRELIFSRPDLLIKSDGTLNTLVDATATTTTLIFDKTLRGALSDYVAHLALTQDDPDTENAVKAARHRKAFYQKIMGASLVG